MKGNEVLDAGVSEDKKVVVEKSLQSQECKVEEKKVVEWKVVGEVAWNSILPVTCHWVDS